MIQAAHHLLNTTVTALSLILMSVGYTSIVSGGDGAAGKKKK